MPRLWKELIVVFVLANTAIWATGCQQRTAAPSSSAGTSAGHSDDHDHDHGHGHEHNHKTGETTLHGKGHVHAAGPHGGVVVDWGGGKYHVELTIDPTKKEAFVYVLGSDEKTPTPITTADEAVLLTFTTPSLQLALQPMPLDGETVARASRYSATHDQLGVKQRFVGSISAEVDGTPYAGDFER
ncbi:MAG: hypothetical protein ACKO38_00590 [Planctomycetota bacterium]